MFSALDILNLVIIAVLTIAFAMMLRFDALLERPRVYLKALLLIVLFIVINDELVYNGLTRLTIILTPLNYFALFLIYPVLYLYLRDMVFQNTGTSNQKQYQFFILPALIFFVLLFCFIFLPAEMHEMFIIKHISNNNGDYLALTLIRILIIGGYYLQTLFFLRKIHLIKSEYYHVFGHGAAEAKIVRLSVIFVPVIILYEGVLLLTVSFLSVSDFEIRVIELIASLIFVLFALYIIFNHSEFLLQLRFEKIHALSAAESYRVQLHSAVIPDEKEAEGIRMLLEDYLRKSKAYLDPNLSIESLGKKIHVQSRKISFVINHLYQKNFHGFINEFRITEAVSILRSGKQNNLEELYSKVGFNSRSTFNRVFKSVMGHNPSEYVTKI